MILGPAHPLRGGLAAFNERLARSFQAEGHRVTIFSFSLQYPSFLFPGKSQTTNDPAPKDLNIVTTVNSINPFNWILVGLRLMRLKPDILVFKYWLPFMAPCFGTIARITRLNRHTRTICILDNVVPHEKRPGDRLLTHYFISSIEVFIAMSRQVLNDLRTFTKNKKALLIPHPIYDHYGPLIPPAEARIRLGLEPQTRCILFFGFIRGYKGLDLLIEAMAQPILDDFDGKVIVAGEFYEDQAPYTQRIKELNLTDRFILRNDYIPDDEVRHYFSAADIVVQPYHSATQSGISQMAFHFNKPMIVTDVGGLPEIVHDGKTGWVVPRDPVAIALAIHKTYASGVLDKLVEEVKEEKKKYDWKHMVDGVFQLTSPDTPTTQPK
ncbi:MAG: hypothetical protein RLZZ630_1696 [Bacteroidota bacterium]